MRHKEIRKKLLRYIDGELSEVERDEIKLHLQHCKRCQKDIALLSRVWNLSPPIERPQPSPSIWNGIMARLNSKSWKNKLAPRVNVFIRQVAEPALTMALLAMALFVGIQIGTYLNTNASSENQAARTNNELQNEFGLQNFQLLTSESLGGEMAALMNYESE